MSFWKMAREPPQEAGKDASKKDAEKPLPDPNSQRPGTSGTEMALMTNRRRASEKYQQAQRAERTYVAKKRSATARAARTEAKAHFREAARHLRLALRLSVSVVKNTPYLVSERAEARRAKADEAKRTKTLEKRKRLEEALARESAASSEAADEDDDKPAGTAS